MPLPDDPEGVRTFGFRVPRFSTSFHFYVEVVATRERLDAMCANISEEGLAAELTRTLKPGTKVTLFLLFPGSTVPLRLQASVQYLKDLVHGFTFSYTSEDERGQVLAFLQTLTA